jgi:hypothetical protein
VNQSHAQRWRETLSSPRHTLPAIARHVGLAASLYADADGCNVRPGVARLKEDTNLSERSIRDMLAKLVDAGWLKLSAHGGRRGGRGMANVYSLTIPPHLWITNPARGAPPQDVPLNPAGDAPYQPKTNPLLTSSAALPSATPEAVDDQLSKVREALNDAAPAAAQIRRPA